MNSLLLTHPDAKSASGSGTKATDTRQAVILRMRGRAQAEIGQLKGETQSKSHPLLRWEHSFWKVREVTCDLLHLRCGVRNGE
jgi:hypothetical protein